MNVPDGLVWELVIVDNGSTDRTCDVVESFKSKLPIRAIIEENPGQSNARNAGIREAVGKYIVWTDDDVLVDPNWLLSYVAAVRQWPDAAVFGGRILPLLEGSSPKWFMENLDLLGGVVVSRDFGERILPLSLPEDRVPFGANYAIRAVEQRANLYDPSLGLKPGRSRRAEEVEVIKTILRAGATGYYIPDSIVRHVIPQTRQTRRYVFSWFRGHGDARAYLEHRGKEAGGHRIFGIPTWLWHTLAKTWTKYLFNRMFVPRRSSLLLYIDHAMARGAADYFRTTSHGDQ